VEGSGEEKYKELIDKCLFKFYEHMNREAKLIGMKKTNYASAHGMYVEENTSTAADVAKLCYVTMKNEKFRQIVS
jgi:D-alanyl-D-alanine carboxypeptidase